MNKKGPFRIIVDIDDSWPFNKSGFSERIHSCINYHTCLEVAATLNWDDFSCRSCVGQINPAVLAQAENKLKKDSLANHICNSIKNNPINDDLEKVA